MSGERKFLTKKQALSLIPKRGKIHTFRNTGSILIGADWSASSLQRAIKEAGKEAIEIGGELCQKMGHGLVIWTSETNPLFVEVDKLKLLKLEK